MSRLKSVGNTRRVHELGNALFSTTLAKQETSSRSMGKNVAADRLATIGTGEESTCTRIRLHLIRHEDDNVEFGGKLGKLAKEETKLLLSLTELASTDVVAAEEVEDRVNDEQPIISGNEICRQLQQEFVLCLTVWYTCVDDVVVDQLPISW